MLSQVQVRLILSQGLRRGGGRVYTGDWTVTDDRELLAAYWSGQLLSRIFVRGVHDRYFDGRRRLQKIRIAFGEDGKDARLLEVLEWPRALPPSAELLRKLFCRMLLAPNAPDVVEKVEAALVRLRAARAAACDTGACGVTVHWLGQLMRATMETEALDALRLHPARGGRRASDEQHADDYLSRQRRLWSTSGVALVDVALDVASECDEDPDEDLDEDEMRGAGGTRGASTGATDARSLRGSGRANASAGEPQPTRWAARTWCRARTPPGECARRSCHATRLWWHEPRCCGEERVVQLL